MLLIVGCEACSDIPQARLALRHRTSALPQPASILHCYSIHHCTPSEEEVPDTVSWLLSAFQPTLTDITSSNRSWENRHEGSY